MSYSKMNVKINQLQILISQTETEGRDLERSIAEWAERATKLNTGDQARTTDLNLEIDTNVFVTCQFIGQWVSVRKTHKINR